MEETAEQQEPSSGLGGADPPDRSAGRESPSKAMRPAITRDLDVVEEAEHDGDLTFESWAWASAWEGDEFDGPEDRNWPAEGVSLEVAAALDCASVHPAVSDGDDVGGNKGLQRRGISGSNSRLTQALPLTSLPRNELL